MSRSQRLNVKKILKFAFFFFFIYLIFINTVTKEKPKEKQNEIVYVVKNETTTVKPIQKKNWPFEIKNIKAVIFYGRRQPASILMRYLERNVKQNGGILDKIVFAKCTADAGDVYYLETLLKQNKSYIETIDDCPLPRDGKGYGTVYEKFEDDDLIFKIDDDIVFIANGTFEKMLDYYMDNNLMFLSANVINHYFLSWVHARMTAIVPFRQVNPRKWEFDNSTTIDKLISTYKYATFSKWWEDPKAAVIAHESFLYQFKKNRLDLYDFKVWNFNTESYDRWSINFVLMRGSYVNNMRKLIPTLDIHGLDKPTITDEVAISQELPRIYGKHTFALGPAIVCHYSYYTQANYLYTTDILDKYDDAAKIYLNIK